MKKVLFVLGLFLLVPSLGFAQVVINEIAWMGSLVEGVDSRQEWRYEWLELYNAGEEAVSLQGWKIELYDAEGLDFTVGLYGVIGANGHLVVGASDKIPGVDSSYNSLVGKLKNDGERVVLKNAAGEVIEELDASGGWFAGDNDSKLTMERRFPDRSANNEESWGSSLTTGGTPKTQNSVFGKEAVVRLEPQAFSATTKESPLGLPFLPVVTNTVFILAFALAVGSALSILALRRYLELPRKEDLEHEGR